MSQSEQVPYVNGYDYGVGVHTLTGSIRGDSVIRTSPEDVTGAGGQRSLYFQDQITSRDQFDEVMGVSVKAGGSYMGLFSASAAVDFTKEVSIDSYSLTYYLKVDVTNSFRRMRDVKLNSDAWDLLSAGKQDDFLKRYGNMFVLGMSTGGILVAILRVETRSEKEKQELAVKVSADAKFGVGEFSLDASFESNISSLSSSGRVTTSIFQEGGFAGIGTEEDDDVDASVLFDKAKNFAPSVAGDQSVPTSCLLMDYQALPSPPGPNFVDMQHAKDVLSFVVKKRNRMLQLQSDIDYCLNNRDQFEPFNHSKMADSQSQVLGALETLYKSGSRCANNVMDCEFPKFDEPNVELPKRVPSKKVFVTKPILAALPGALKKIEIDSIAKQLSSSQPEVRKHGIGRLKKLPIRDRKRVIQKVTNPEYKKLYTAKYIVTSLRTRSNKAGLKKLIRR